MTDEPSPLVTALVAEATKKSGLIWVTVPGVDRPLPLWHLWHEGAAYVVTGGAEQPAPRLDRVDEVAVTVRSKDKGGRLLTWVATPVPIEPGSPEWETVVPQLHAKRLNAPDGEAAPARWARESRVTRLAPTGEVLESPDEVDTRSLAGPPPGGPGTTPVPLPFWVGRRPHRRGGSRRHT